MKKTFKKTLALLLAAMMIISIAPLSLSAEEATYGDLTYEITDGEVTITGCNVLVTVVEIPETIEGYPVTSIGDEAFADFYSLTSVTIPDSVTSIGNYAFCACSSLTSITIPDSVTSIDNNAFIYCISLTSITVDKNNDYYSSDEYGVLFNKDKTLLIKYPEGSSETSFIIPDSVTSIGNGAFINCSSLTSITIPDSVTSIGDYAFDGCESLISITIPDSVTSIGNGAFINCSSLTSITIPDSVASIGDYAFSACYSLTNITVDKNNLWYSSDEYGVLFNKNKTLLIKNPEGSAKTSYIIPDSVASIGNSAFRNCDSLTSITIPDSVTSIGEDAFSNCDSLTSITIPDSVTSIGDYAFSGCDSLTSITIPDSVTSIGDYAFSGCDSLTSITIPDSVTSIGNCAFTQCISLTSITIPDSVTSIGNHAFDSCESLTSITIPDSVTSIGVFAFEYCISLTSITVNKNNDYYSSDEYGVLFNKEKTLLMHYPAGKTSTSYIIPDSVTSIGDRAFSWCISLTSITIPDGVTSIGNSAFSFCFSLTSITIPDSVTIIDNWAFEYCTSLTSITINNPDCEIYDSEGTINSGATIYGYCGSTAQAYAEKYNRNFVAEHYYSAEATTPATHLTEGIMTYTCACGDTYTEVIEKLTAHEYTAVVTAPTCTEKGYTTYTCVCGDSYIDDYVNADGHSYASEITTPATHFATGLKTFTCNVCGDSYTEVIEKLTAHEYTAVVTAPTCTEKGYTTYTCVCGDSYVADYVDSLGHTDSNSDSVCDECSASIKTVDKYIFKNLTEFFQFLKELIMKIIRFFTQGI